jgi:hypothetical protein
MAFMSQATKKELAPKIKEIAKKYHMNVTIGVKNHSTLVININSGDLDIIGNYIHMVKNNPRYMTFNNTDYLEGTTYIQVNQYNLDSYYSGKILDFLTEINEVANSKNFDESDLMTDYHHVGYYVDINVGHWDKPYICTGAKFVIDTTVNNDYFDINKAIEDLHSFNMKITTADGTSFIGTLADDIANLDMKPIDPEGWMTIFNVETETWDAVYLGSVVSIRRI